MGGLLAGKAADMTGIHLDSYVSDSNRRKALYDGDIFVYSPRPSTLALAAHARAMLESAFSPHDPTGAQYDMPVEEFVERFAPVKPAFIHNPQTRALLRDVIAEFGCSEDDTYLDVPRLRGVTSDGYLTSGVGYAHHPHRDTWYSAPMCQLNWWIPVFEYDATASMDFHLRHWDEPVTNGSSDFNYYEWNAVGRASAASQINSDTRKQPKPTGEIELDPAVRFVVPVGGLILFSPAHLHSTVPNTSGRARFSIDFRTVSRSDLEDGRAAPNIDSEPTGTSLRDFLSPADQSPLPDELIARYDDGSANQGVLVFKPGSP
jgi:hypothetical protein